MIQAKSGDKVKVHYNGTLADGSVFDSSQKKEPIVFVIGEEKLIPGFERALIGMQPGETKDIAIPAKEAYGEKYQDLVTVVAKKAIPEDIELKAGIVLEVTLESGVPVNFAVIDVADDKVTLDANHPLAGKELNFNIELMEILEA